MSKVTVHEAHLETIVRDITTPADGIKVVTLTAAHAQPLPTWSPGAHVDVHIPGGLTRQYSLCSDPHDLGVWRFAVLREPASTGGSSWLHEALRIGDTIETSPPRNHFPLQDADEYLFIAGGIGITPLLAMIREVHARGNPWRLLYGGRRLQSMAFTDELACYGPDNVLIRPEDQYGLLDLAGALGEPRQRLGVYCCGPGPLLDAVERQCQPWPAGALHLERFQPKEGLLDRPTGEFAVVLSQSGVTLTVGADESIVDAVTRAGVDVLTSCGEGTCGTCETAVLAGVPDHRDSILTSKEQAKNDVMMLCCSRALTPSLVLDL